MELALCHPSGTGNFEVASRLLENLCSPALGYNFTIHTNVTAGGTRSKNCDLKCYNTMVTKCTTCCNGQHLELLALKQASVFGRAALSFMGGTSLIFEYYLNERFLFISANP